MESRKVCCSLFWQYPSAMFPWLLYIMSGIIFIKTFNFLELDENLENTGLGLVVLLYNWYVVRIIQTTNFRYHLHYLLKNLCVFLFFLFKSCSLIRNLDDGSHRFGAGVLSVLWESAFTFLSCGYDTAVKYWDMRVNSRSDLRPRQMVPTFPTSQQKMMLVQILAICQN